MEPSVELQGDAARLEALIAKIDTSGKAGLVREHLETAHSYLVGAMRAECEHNLDLARTAARALPDQPLTRDIQQTIDQLLRDLRAARSSELRIAPVSSPYDETADGLTEFLHGSEVSLGMFYPKKHVVAVFRSMALAEMGRERILAAGFRAAEAIAVGGTETEKFLDGLPQTLLSGVMAGVSHFLDTEASLDDRYRAWARDGAAFLIVHCPTDQHADKIAKVLKPLDPLAMHWFMAGYIRHLLPTG